ncbi:maleylpyruvate isomerase family mycothiol-dependent enzyme [Amycolatopsis sp. SID8362]|uniref:maleylpyruvate isomerase family mycothiol-dependent enzyme n=1 Tax=Amycolatopsis sp. SID8362 TaxID=2690346 RepID=UPI001369CCBD|nr:maleylpyruvate isomerase family mycothiol-dependent enzyme [Amycolatopsis sp. SID8362]NBH12386.1 maleylpyruvate isomerase family mycothiol-dependent enzyme [Amycolatopsis sp. SID8362]NED49078.1 maleylpyruvate isomerase family protein [Amycolatopsis sp. SID8362]
MTVEQWESVRAALPDVGGRFADLVASVPDAHAKSLGEWSIAETASHVGMIALMYTAMIRGDGGPLPLPGLEEPIDSASVDTISRMNALALELYPERDPVRLAERLRADIAEVLLVSADLDPEKPVWWLGGSRVPVAGVLAHLVNEMLLHGLDIARALGRPWPVPARYEAMFLELFLFGMVRNDMGSLLDDATPSPRRIAVEFRSAYTKPGVLALQHGRLRFEEPDGTADVRLRFDPAVLVPMMFGRISKARAVLTSGVRISGRRPWLLPEFLRTVRMP